MSLTMTKRHTNTHTSAWKFQVWASFVVSSCAMALGILYLPVDLWTKGFFAMGLLFTITSCFGLAKTVRDEAETERHQFEDQAAPERQHPFRSAA